MASGAATHRRHLFHQNVALTRCITSLRYVAGTAAAACCLWVTASLAGGEEVVLRDGRVLSGKLGIVTGLADLPKPADPEGGGPIPLIVFVDDELRRTFVPKRLIREIRPGSGAEMLERYHIPQRVSTAGMIVSSVGFPLRVTPFDEFGRRIFTLTTSSGRVDVIQGITELTPRWVRVQGITHVWDMRMATTSLPRDVLERLLLGPGGPPDLEARKKAARFYIQMERYEDALAQLQAILEDPAVSAQAKAELQSSFQVLKQLSARRILEELKARRAAGQHQTVMALLQKFPTEGVAGDILQEVREILEEYQKQGEQAEGLVARLRELVRQIDETALRKEAGEAVEEIASRLSPDTLPRLAAFSQFAEDASVPAEERVGLAVTGWYLGADRAARRLPVGLSLRRVRNLIFEYFAAEDALSRGEVLQRIVAEEGGSPNYLAYVLQWMEPPLAPPPPLPNKIDCFEINLPLPGELPPTKYYVQLPPEYQPLRKYPAIVVLHGAEGNPLTEIDWWAGETNDRGMRLGQAGRRGYIVIAPAWTAERQQTYQYSLREHLAVLESLRDAMKRFSIDSDRVYLGGHFLGGDAAWDIGLAHPSLWAGVIPISGRADRFCALYWQNAALLPFYVVMGEFDGTLVADNARDLDRYLNRAYDVTAVEYRGRGRDGFSDEILRVFDWMERFRRQAAPAEFLVRTARIWDNFFWYVEVEDFPPAVIIDPASWPPRNPMPMQIRGRLTQANTLFVQAGGGRTTVRLNPDLVDFERRISLTVNGRQVDPREIRPSTETLLEDVRQRGDRQHPSWYNAVVGGRRPAATTRGTR